MSAAFFAPIPRTSARADTSALADGTTHLRFDPLELLERLAVLTPRKMLVTKAALDAIKDRSAKAVKKAPGNKAPAKTAAAKKAEK